MGYRTTTAHMCDHLQVFLYCTAMNHLTILYCIHLCEMPLTENIAVENPVGHVTNNENLLAKKRTQIPFHLFKELY